MHFLTFAELTNLKSYGYF